MEAEETVAARAVEETAEVVMAAVVRVKERTERRAIYHPAGSPGCFLKSRARMSIFYVSSHT